jgi:CHAT domain-containing protein
MKSNNDKALYLMAESENLFAYKKYAEAELKANEAITYFDKKSRKSSNYAEGLNTLARIAIELQKGKEALNYAEKAQKIMERIFSKDHHRTYSCLTTIGMSNTTLKNYALAEVQLTQASLGIKKIFGRESIHYLNSLQVLALFFIRTENAKMAEETLIEIMEVYFIVLKNNFQDMNYEERLAFIDTMFGHLLIVFSYLAKNKTHSPEFLAKTFILRLNVKRTLLEGSEKLFISENTFMDFSSRLSDEEAVIEIVRFWEVEEKETGNIFYLFYIVTSETKKSPIIVTIKNGLQLEGELFGAYHSDIKSKSIDYLSYNSYWKMIKDLIPDKKRIYVSADGIYQYINLETLIDDNGKYLFDDIEIIQCNDLRNLPLKDRRLSEYPKNALLLANPLFYSEDVYKRNRTIEEYLPSIPSSEEEIESVGEILKKSGWSLRKHIKEEVTKDKFENMEEVGLLHIATHGILRATPIKPSSFDDLFSCSGLLLSNLYVYSEKGNIIHLDRNGYLDSGDILKMNLSNVELVVLSACESGRGAMLNLGESFGFERTFFLAGVKAIIMSLWKVDDAITKELMISFYTNWMKSGDKFSSFRAAQQEIKQKHRQPLYWAGFVLIHC